MKKMIFSAVALVAFSFAGMANEVEELKTASISPCAGYALVNALQEEQAIGGFSSGEEFQDAINFYYNMCVDCPRCIMLDVVVVTP
jgi:hypothetical protein